MKKLLLMLLLFPIALMAQNRFSISGTVTGEDGNPIAFANIVLDKNNKYAVSDENGKYDIQGVRPGEYVVTVSSLGFANLTRNISVNQDLSLDFTLTENVQNLDDVTVEGKKASTRQEEQAITIGSFELADVVSQTNILADAVDRISGVRIRRSGSLGDQSDVAINGLNGSAVRTYIDGIPLEFLYPQQDIATLPLSGIKRVDVYKGVIPVDVGTDALGGGINIITEDNFVNRISASYSVGSFNTHLADINATFVDKNDNFLKANMGMNYSDNDYSFRADLRIQNPFFDPNVPGSGNPFIDIEDQNVRRFHDRYQFQYGSLTVGTRNKTWTDSAQLIFNYQNGEKEIQNGPRITNIAAGEAFYEAENLSLTLKYDKTILKDRIKLRTISNYSDDLIKFVDTTANAYNWLGDIIFVDENRRGEFNDGAPALIETNTKNYVNRSTLDFNIAENQKLTLSNIFARQERTVTDFDIDNPSESFELPEESISKNIMGLQYDDNFLKDFVEFSAAAKYYSYTLNGISFLNQIPIESKEGFLGWNAGLKLNLVEGLSLRGSYERGFLIPEVFQFAGNATGVVPNGEIRPEESDNYNLGLQYNTRFNDSYALTFTANGFIRNQRDIIFLNINRNPLQYVNADDVDSQGVEGELKVNFLEDFNWVSNVSFIDKTFASVNSAGGTNDFLIGSPFPNTPQFFYNTELSWQKENLFKTGIDFRIYGLFTHVDEFNFIPVGNEDTIENSPDSFIPKQDRLDFGISMTFFERKFTASFNMINVTDEDLFDNFSIPRPGRNFNFKLIYEISNF